MFVNQIMFGIQTTTESPLTSFKNWKSSSL
jgi:hypothetical protein